MVFPSRIASPCPQLHKVSQHQRPNEFSVPTGTASSHSSKLVRGRRVRLDVVSPVPDDTVFLYFPLGLYVVLDPVLFFVFGLGEGGEVDEGVVGGDGEYV